MTGETKSAAKETILSGMRPSGKLHLGNYFGALANWIKLQDAYRCYYMVADYHALTSEYGDTSGIERNVDDMVIDWLSAGLDPERAILFRQSWVKEHAELFLFFSMITPVPWLERCPTYREQIEEIQNKDLSTFGFLGYPVLQAADILVYRASRVPVGEDQLPHVEITREIARRFNFLYGAVFPEPQALLSPSPKVPGLDGRKMSKSYGNALLLSDSPAEVQAKIKTMYTDPAKIHLGDKGHPEGCVVFACHRLYTAEWADIEIRCRAGTLGCADCKKRLAVTLNAGLDPFREKRVQWERRPDDVKAILREGSRKATEAARQTMDAVYTAMKLLPRPGGWA